MLYVHLKKSFKAERNAKVLLGDVARIYLGDALAEPERSVREKALAGLAVGKTGGSASGVAVVTGTDIARVLDGKTQFCVMGAPLCAVSVKPQPQHGKVLTWVKIAALLALLFIGGAMTIMNFQTDVDMPGVHRKLSDLLLGRGGNPLWISIPYSVGIVAGVLFFSNILPGKRKEPSIFELEQYQMDQELEQFESSRAEDRL